MKSVVKEYIPSTEPWTASQVPRMYSDLEAIHKLGILVNDIHQGNFLGGKRINFSRAWTSYHMCLDRFTPGDVYDRRLEEPAQFEEMVDTWAYSEGQEIEKPDELVQWHSRRGLDLWFNPRYYDWEKWSD